MADEDTVKLAPAVLTATAAALGLAVVALEPWAESLIGPGLARLGELIGLAGIVAFILTFTRYFGILGRGDEASYHALRDALAAGDTKPVEIYARRLDGVLNWVDRFFGDAGHPGQRWPFGLDQPRPLWTAASYDRTLLLALVYPLLSVFVVWVLYGESANIDVALGLNGGIGKAHRALSAFAIILVAYFSWANGHRSSPGNTAGLWVTTGLGAIFCYGVITFSTALAIAATIAAVTNKTYGGLAGIFGAVVFVLTIPDAFAILGNVAALFSANAPGDAIKEIAHNGIFNSLTLSFVLLIAGAAIIVCIDSYRRLAQTKGGAWLFSAVFTGSAIAGCLEAPRLLALGQNWNITGSLLLVLGLLTLVNAPFDWAAIGLTRGLLRRGIEKGGWWPWRLAILDAAAALALIVALTGVTVEAVQLFDWSAIRGGGAAVLPLPELFDDIAAAPAAPRHWWVYALLLSTLIPSVINLTIGGASLVRGLPLLPQWLAAQLPAERAPPGYDRLWMAGLLALQWPLGLMLATASLAASGWLLFGTILPLTGWRLLDLARALVW